MRTDRSRGDHFEGGGRVALALLGMIARRAADLAYSIRGTLLLGGKQRSLH